MPEEHPAASASNAAGDAAPVTGIRLLDAALDKAVAIPSAAIHQHVDRLRRRNPHASPAQIVGMLEKQYLLAISASGGAVGAAAAAPAIGTGTALALTSSEVATFFAASAAFSLAVADVHGIAVEDTARRRALLLATVLGEQGAKTIGAKTGLDTSGWARGLLVNMPTRTIRTVNNALTRRFLRHQVARHSGLALGRLIPFGVGAAIGVTGARALGRTVITSARRAFGPPPHGFPRGLDIVIEPRTTGGLPARLRLPSHRGKVIAPAHADDVAPPPGTPAHPGPEGPEHGHEHAPDWRPPS